MLSLVNFNILTIHYCLNFDKDKSYFSHNVNYQENKGLSWSYGSWIYNYMCNQCLSPLKLLSSNPVNGEVYSIQHYVIKFDSVLRQVDGYLCVLQFPPPITDCHDIIEILLKVALNTINQPKPTNKNITGKHSPVERNDYVISWYLSYYIELVEQIQDFSKPHSKLFATIPKLWHKMYCIWQRKDIRLLNLNVTSKSFVNQGLKLSWMSWKPLGKYGSRTITPRTIAPLGQ